MTPFEAEASELLTAEDCDFIFGDDRAIDVGSLRGRCWRLMRSSGVCLDGVLICNLKCPRGF